MGISAMTSSERALARNAGFHDASIVSLEELFDPNRLDPECERKSGVRPA
jgi:hypothetical protein